MEDMIGSDYAEICKDKGKDSSCWYLLQRSCTTHKNLVR